MSEEKTYIENWSIKSEFNIRTILDVLIAKWQWFALSVFLCLVLAYVYIRTVPVVYKREAIVQLKNVVKTEEAFNEKQMFSESNNNVDGEILIFKSRLLMGEVIGRLGLDISYSVDDGLKSRDLYTDSPLKVSFPDSSFIQPASFIIVPVHNNTFRLKGLKDDPDGVMEYTYGKPLDSPIGRMVVSRTSFFMDEMSVVPIQVTCADRESLTSLLLGKLEAERSVKNANLLTLTYQDTNPKRGDDVLNTLIQVYVDESMRDKNAVIRNTAFFIDERLKLINQELGDVENNIEDYRKRNQSADFEIESKLYLENRNRRDQEVTELVSQVELIGLVQLYLHDPLKSERLLPINSGIKYAGIDELIRNYNTVLQDRDRLRVNAGNNSPAVKERNEELVSLRQTISQSLRNMKETLKVQLEYARRSQMLEVNRIGTIPTQQKYILSVERQQKIKEDLFLYLLNKREENALTLATADSNLRIVDKANEAEQAGANALVILLSALIAGMAIPGLVFYIQPMLDVTVRGRKDLEDVLTIPFLGEIPRKKEKEDIVVDSKKRDMVSEAYRIVRSNLDFVLTKKSGSQVLMFTSSNPGAGKSFISSNLAVSLALAGKRVILLEMDIRKGSGKNAAGEIIPGLTHYLSGNITRIDDLIHSGMYHSDLDVISSGPVPPNPAELLLGHQLDELITKLKERYEYILIDTAPYGMIADARIISRVTDLNVYIIREGRMDRRQLPDVEKLYTEGKLPHMAVLLNDTCYKYAGYGYNYGYGYGYYLEEKKKR